MKFDKMRVLQTGKNVGAWNMAVDEFLLGCEEPVLRIYGWSRPCVSIGYFQSIDDINYERCVKEKIDVVRRSTGGGAVFHDAELTYSFVTKNFPQNILRSYEEVCQVIIGALEKLGLAAKFSPLNDVTVNGRKVCGNAQTRKNGRLLQHGTILLDVNAELMFSLLNVPQEKIQDKQITNPKDRVLGIGKKFDDVSDALKNSARETFGCVLVPYDLEKYELEACDKIMREKYSTRQWTCKR